MALMSRIGRASVGHIYFHVMNRGNTRITLFHTTMIRMDEGSRCDYIIPDVITSRVLKKNLLQAAQKIQRRGGILVIVSVKT